MYKVYLKAMVPLLVFAGIQGLGGVAVLVLGSDATTLSLAVMLSGLISAVILWKMGMVRGQAAYEGMPEGRTVIFGAVAAFSSILATDMLNELVDLPDLMQQQFMDMARGVWGIIAIGLVGPVVEELVFREAILGHMLRNGVGRWSAVLVSALLFGLVHGNPVQIPFACVVGVVFALIYCKTGNVLLTSAVHIINNTIAVVQMNLLGDQLNDIHFYDYIGKTAEVFVIACLFLICVVCLRRLMVK